jgi:hypothetical protein
MTCHAKDKLPVATLREAIEYSPETGKMFYRYRPESDFVTAKLARWWNTHNAGREAFTLTNRAGYKHGSVHQVRIMAHRAAWAVHHGKWPSGQIDHINGDPADNRIQNLRVVSQSENQRNKRVRKDNTSGVPGVFWLKRIRRWQAMAPDGHGGAIYLGVFKTLEDAAEARARATRDMGFGPQHGRAAA